MTALNPVDRDLIQVMVQIDELAQSLLARIHLNLLLGKPVKPLFDIMDMLTGNTPEDQERKRKQREVEEREERRKRDLPYALKAVDMALSIYGAGSHEHQSAVANADRLAVRAAS